MLRTSRHNSCISPCLAQCLKLVSSSFSCWDFVATLYPLAITSMAFLRRFCSHTQRVDSKTPYEVTQGDFESDFLQTIDIFPTCSDCLLRSTISRAKTINTELMTTFSPSLKLIFTIRTRTFKKSKQTPWQREENEGWYKEEMLPRRKRKKGDSPRKDTARGYKEQQTRRQEAWLLIWPLLSIHCMILSKFSSSLDPSFCLL